MEILRYLYETIDMIRSLNWMKHDDTHKPKIRTEVGVVEQGSYLQQKDSKTVMYKVFTFH